MFNTGLRGSMLEPWVPSGAFISFFGTLLKYMWAVFTPQPPLHSLLENGYAFQICQLKNSSLQRPPSQYEIARQIFWSWGFKLPVSSQAVQVSWRSASTQAHFAFMMKYFIEDFTHAYSVFWQINSPAPSSPIPDLSPFPLFFPNFLWFFSFLSKTVLVITWKFHVLYFDHILPPFLPY